MAGVSEVLSPMSEPTGPAARAFQALAAQYERKSHVVELRFFGGLSVEETAEVLKISPETVMRDWKFAKNWLMRELSRTGTAGA
jgi:DNA-directed RNA polymerase specialized sigma24 family protein